MSKKNYTQDIIYRKDGVKMEVKIKSFTNDMIIYNHIKFLNDPARSIKTRFVKYVKHQGVFKYIDGTPIIIIEDSFTDERDGIIYRTITLAGQTWMAENLRATTTRDGQTIPLVIDKSKWGNLQSYDAAYCYYNNNENGEKETYGALYTYAAAKEACPAGWHLPTDEEWYTFISNIAEIFDCAVSEVGGLLKEEGTMHWKSPNEGASNRLLFSALPGGNRGSYGNFNYLGINGYWWSAAEDGRGNAYNRYLIYGSPEIGRNYYDKSYGFSVRCVRD
jgi:uncharacterized protein (TIGR02145 family)